ncbi:MAG TPA: divalent-cation tolerance protein CutA [Verrucomicrobiae bacterium]|nr:divalent-cation tolerance protein CutA [Verrucomicrobiae bacterium]
MPKNQFVMVLVTAPELRTARRLAKSALAARLAACINLIPKVESHYHWHGKIEQASEVLMLLKTNSSRLVGLERLILSEHPYVTPEFIVLHVKRGNKRYLRWWQQCVS